MKQFQRLFISGVVGVLAILSVWASPLAQAQTLAAPPRTPRPVAARVGLIELTAAGAAGGWAVVQWRDALGHWQAVDGWQGQVDADGRQTWTVLEPEFEAQTFRWQVYDRLGGALLGTSATFNLPANGGTTRITVGTSGAGYAFAAQMERRPLASGCAIAGQVLDAAGQPLKEYQVRLMYDTGASETVKSGGAPAYGPAGYAFLWEGFTYPHRYTVQLFTADGGTALSAAQGVDLPGPCRANLIWLNFQPTR